MTGVSLVVTDTEVAVDTGIVWVASATTNGFIQIVNSAGSFTITSTVAETVSFTYYLFK